MEVETLLSRRELLKGLGAAGALSLFAFLGGCEELIEIIENRPVRRDISKLAPDDPIIDTYKAAVSAMKGLPPGNRRNWTQQAQIHLNHCPHGNWYFLPWHRAYLLAFEQICRQLTGNKDFALPYWNWTANPSVPAVFWGQNNPLFDGTRRASATDVANAGFVGPAVLDAILNEPNFFAFASGKVNGQRDFDTYGRLEGTPHNYIHVFVGGDMGNYMSPLDPVFWMHHNMVECCWVEWNLNRQHPNTNDPQWMNFTFAGDFVDQNGSPFNVTVVETLLYPLLAYRFEPCFPAAHAAAPSRVTTRAEAKALVKFAKQGAPVRWEFLKRFELQRALTVEVGRPATGSIKLQPEPFRSALAAENRNQLLLTVGGVELPNKADYFVRVFLNKPDASQETSLDDPHYAGSFAFFFDESAGHHEGTGGAPKAGYLVDVAETLRRLSRAGALPSSEQLDVRLVAVPFERREATGQHFTLDRLELGIAQVSK